ncbi:MAG: hypothetical protein IPQ00_07260 [Chloracidobacterium sp.]|nr:hypothetical protein [Chloracidobacterium sp.]
MSFVKNTTDIKSSLSYAVRSGSLAPRALVPRRPLRSFARLSGELGAA